MQRTLQHTDLLINLQKKGKTLHDSEAIKKRPTLNKSVNKADLDSHIKGQREK